VALSSDIPGVAIQLSRGVVVASIQVDLDDEVLARFRDDLLGRIRESGSPRVILDVSGLETLDTEEFEALRRIITMARLMGAEAVVAGLRPGVVSSLITAGADIDDLRAAVDLDAAFAEFYPEAPGEPEPEDLESEDLESEDASVPDGEPAPEPIE